MKILKNIGKVCVVLAIILVIAGFGMRFGGERQVASRIAALRAAGMPVSTDPQGKPVPDSQNSAVIYGQAFKIMKEPKIQAEMNNLYDIVLQDRKPSSKDWSEAQNTIDRLGKLYDTLEQAQTRPLCRFDNQVDFSADIRQQQRQMEEQVNVLASLNQSARLFEIRALVCAHARDSEGFLDNIEHCLKTTEAFHDRPVIISYLVESAIMRIALRGINESYKYCELNESQLNRLDTLLSAIKPADLYKNALIGERAYSLQKLKQEGLGSLPQTGLDTAAYLDLMQLQIDSTSLSYSEALSKGVIGQKETLHIPWYALTTRIFAPVLARTSEWQYKDEATIACCRMSLAIEEYRSRSGRYPATLAELKKKLPLDPFTGQSLIYKPKPNGYLIYSVGPNQKDNGGKDNTSAVDADDLVCKVER